VRWFGKPWNPSACVPSEKMDTPVGEKCPKCTSHIEEGDQGIVLLCATSINFESEQCEVVAEAWHLDCFLRRLLPPDFLKRHPRAVSQDPGKN